MAMRCETCGLKIDSQLGWCHTCKQPRVVKDAMLSVAQNPFLTTEEKNDLIGKLKDRLVFLSN